MSEEELNEDIKNNKTLDVTCNFCQHVYHVTPDDLKDVLKMKKTFKYEVK